MARYMFSQRNEARPGRFILISIVTLDFSYQSLFRIRKWAARSAEEWHSKRLCFWNYDLNCQSGIPMRSTHSAQSQLLPERCANWTVLIAGEAVDFRKEKLMNRSRFHEFGFYSARSEYSRSRNESTRGMSEKPDVSGDLDHIGKKDVFREFRSAI
jgi:hypothetical protein